MTDCQCKQYRHQKTVSQKASALFSRIYTKMRFPIVDITYSRISRDAHSDKQERFVCRHLYIQTKLSVWNVGGQNGIPSRWHFRKFADCACRIGSMQNPAVHFYMSPVKRICVFEHSVMTNFNCACPAIQRGQGSGFLSEGSTWLTACMSEQRKFWRDCADAQARLNLRCSHRR